MGIALALESSAGLVMSPGMGFRITAMVTLTSGTMFLMWLGEQITERGLGNGISILIFGGIAAGLPNAIGGLLELVRTGAMSILVALVIVVLVALGPLVSRRPTLPPRSARLGLAELPG
jgi:preprotein translocase subunit SecY